jgi:hypothetical protein
MVLTAVVSSMRTHGALQQLPLGCPGSLLRTVMHGVLRMASFVQPWRLIIVLYFQLPVYC